jgi:hypothetical protein
MSLPDTTSGAPSTATTSKNVFSPTYTGTPVSLGIKEAVTPLGFIVGFGIVWVAAGNKTAGNIISLVLISGIVYLSSKIDLEGLLLKSP